jgi:geranylgeranyl diphosphate synthase type II
LSTATEVPRSLDELRARVDSELDRLLPAADAYPESVHRAMRHSVFAGGKRLRPALCIESGRLLGAEAPVLVRMGSALEMIHTYSLIHDDLPALDNDDLRRGQPTCHRAFGEATAILAGDALLTLAFKVLAGLAPIPPDRQVFIIHEVASAIGTPNGMIAGQIADLEAPRRTTTAASLEFIHRAKTGALLRTSVRSGALAANPNAEDLNRLTAYGEKVGLAFQIADDLLDAFGSSAELGKKAGKDHGQRKATYPALYGFEESQRIARKLVDEACAMLDPYRARADQLREIAHFLIARTC